jgi:hypothetical protein
MMCEGNVREWVGECYGGFSAVHGAAKLAKSVQSYKPPPIPKKRATPYKME